MRVYDVASIANKGVSQRIISAPFAALGQDTRIASRNATCVVLPTTQPIHPARGADPRMREINQEQAFHPVYDYAFITDAVEGLIVTDVNTLADGEPRTVVIDLTEDISMQSLGVCGGILNVFIERWSAGYPAEHE